MSINWVNSPNAVLKNKHVRDAIEREVKKEVGIIQRQVLKNMLSEYHLIWLLALRDSEEFGSQRLARVMDKVVVISEDIGANRLTFADIKEALADELTPDFAERYLGVNKDDK